MPSMRKRGSEPSARRRDVSARKPLRRDTKAEACNAAGSTSDSKPSACRPSSHASVRSGCAGSTPITPLDKRSLDKRSQTAAIRRHLQARGPAPVSHIAAALTGQVILSTSVHQQMRGADYRSQPADATTRSGPDAFEITCAPQTGDAHNGGGIRPTCRFL
jgi:hypothetical protein